jgi:hypothetical protein
MTLASRFTTVVVGLFAMILVSSLSAEPKPKDEPTILKNGDTCPANTVCTCGTANCPVGCRCEISGGTGVSFCPARVQQPVPPLVLVITSVLGGVLLGSLITYFVMRGRLATKP